MNEGILAEIKKAGLTVAEFALLCGVSRVAVYKWDTGGFMHKLRKPKVDKICGAIAAAVKAKDFPPKNPGKAKADRAKEIMATVIKHLKKV